MQGDNVRCCTRQKSYGRVEAGYWYLRCCKRARAQTRQNANSRKQNDMCNKLNQPRGGFTLVEIMIVVAIIALLAAIAVPGFLRARKRSQASRILNDLRLIDAACDQYAIEN